MRVVVAAHPSRARVMARRLRDLAIADYEMVLDPDPGGLPSAIRTYMAALETAAAWGAGGGDRPALILQDDAIPHPDVARHADMIVRKHPEALVALYVGSAHAGGRTIRHDAARGKRFAALPLRHFVPTVALIWPAGAPAAFLAWIAANPRRDDRYQDDETVKEWRCASRPRPILAYASIPSLVRHDNTLPSLLNHGHHGPRDALLPWDEWAGKRPWEAGW